MSVVAKFIDEYVSVLDFDMTVEDWFAQLKEV
jgi:hypothetical protein